LYLCPLSGRQKPFISQLKQHIAILGSTGSIGTQALEVVRELRDLFEIEVLTANQNADLLIAQAIEFKPNAVVIADETLYSKVFDALRHEDIKVFAGSEAICQVVESDSIDIVLSALVGFSGLQPTLSAINAGKNIALANKETLVIAGDLITKAASEKGVNIYPVDSEHSAIFQCLSGEFHNKIEKIYLTASGGPFRGKTKYELENVTPAQALKHPNWAMGAKVSIDSSSMMNKGLEVIEAKWLFNLKPEQIEVVIHPQSIIHSMVQFEDGSIKAQLGLPDMKLPIQYAFTYPQRAKNTFKRFSVSEYSNLSFETPDTGTFRNLGLAYEALNRGGNMPCILNAANEIAVAAFLNGKLGFNQMPELIENCMKNISFISKASISDYIETDQHTRLLAEQIVSKEYREKQKN
jgi:1-deoxy-D-xylulose-5-phosphate reductoisomerase